MAASCRESTAVGGARGQLAAMGYTKPPRSQPDERWTISTLTSLASCGLSWRRTARSGQGCGARAASARMPWSRTARAAWSITCSTQAGGRWTSCSCRGAEQRTHKPGR
eukprot:695051-Alexandrium_andersonii.AAC.1